MALDDQSAFGTKLANAAGSHDANGLSAWIALAAVINAQIMKADLKVGAVVVPITGAAGSTPATGSGVLV